MRYVEVEPLPEVCQKCEEWKKYGEQYGVDAVCYNCDYELLRFAAVPDPEENLGKANRIDN